MRVKGKVCVITGAASGIGKALAERFRQEGAKGLVLGDMQADKLEEVAASVGGLAVVTNVAREEDIKKLAKAAEDEYGRVDVFVSNAGIARMGGEDSSDEDWQANWDIHVMAHVYAARAVAEKMAVRGEGYLINTASAAGLLTHVNSATYSVTKHAAVSFAEWLSINYGDRGVHVSVLAPQAVRTAMTTGRDVSVASVDGMIEPEQLADCVIETMDKEEFLILPHEQVREYMKRKALDVDRWLAGMRRFKAKRPEST